MANLSTAAFTIQTAGNTSIIAVDTTNSRITLGVSDTTGTLLVLDTKTGTGDPTGVAGGMYYNSNSGQFRCYDGAWKNCMVSAYGASTASTTSTTTTDTLITGSNITFSAGALKVGTIIKWRVILSKAAAGTQTGMLFQPRMGITGAVATDPVLCTSFGTATQTAAIDQGVLEISVTITSLTAGTGASICGYNFSHTLATTGLDNLQSRVGSTTATAATSAPSAATTVFLSLAQTGTANTITINQVQVTSVGL